MIRRIPDNEGDMHERHHRRRKRRLRTIAMLPTLLTLGNLYFGFAAIYCCAREMQDLGAGVNATAVRTLNNDFLEARAPSFLSIAVWMIIASMICDALDGRVARKTGQASRFGEELDSLADVVSFGVAPALMMVVLARRELAGHFAQATLFIAAIYVCCAALRLARFNVEATLEEASHQGFKGLPSPGAAAAIISLVFLHDHLDIRLDWPRTAALIARILPFCTLALALLMVSRVPYTHAVSSFLRRRPFGHIILVLLILPFIMMYTELTTVIVACGFALSGPVRMLLKRGKPPDEGADSGDAGLPYPSVGKKQS